MNSSIVPKVSLVGARRGYIHLITVRGQKLILFRTMLLLEKN